MENFIFFMMFMPKFQSVLRSITWVDVILFFCFSIGGGHMLVANQEPETFLALIAVPGYWPSLFGSSLTALGVVLFVFFVNRYLDLNHPWFEHFWRRFVRQLAIGAIISVGIAYVLALQYFDFRGVSMVDAEYSRKDFWLVVLLVATLNLFYAAQYAFKAAKGYLYPPEELLEEVTTREEPDISFGIPYSKIAFIYHRERANISVSFAGDIGTARGTISQLYAGLPSKDFFKLDRKIIINRSAIHAVTDASSNRRSCFLNTPYYSGIDYVKNGDQKINCVVVSQRQRKAFDEWWLNG